MVVTRAAIVFALAAIFAALPAFAQLTATFDPPVVAPQQIFELSITAQGSNAETPVLPDAPDFKIVNPNRPSVSSGSSISIVNGAMRQSISRTWTYQVTCDKEGTFSFPPITTKIGGKEFHTESLNITVTKQAQRPRGRGRSSIFDMLDPFSPPPMGNPVDDKIAFEDTVILEWTPDKTEVYVGEPITMTLVVGQLAVQGVGTSNFDQPLTHPQGFYVESDFPQTRVSPTRNGNQYTGVSVKQVWYPTAPGEFNVDPIQWPVTIQRLTTRGFDKRNVMKSTPVVKLTVKPLPPGPADFSGIVGDIKLASAVPSTDMLQGQGVTLIVRVTGSANPATISAPEIPKLDWAFLSPPEADPQQADAEKSLKVFRYTLTPLNDGPNEIPEMKITYFSPSSGKYEPTIAPAIKVNVRKAANAGTVVAMDAPKTGTGAGVKVLADVNPIVHDAGPISPARSGWGLNTLAGAGAPLAYAGLLLYTRHRRRLSEDRDFARDYFARSKSQKRLARVRGAKDPTDELFRALAGFVADKLHVEEGGLTSSDARQAIARRGLPSELADVVEKILRACERARYAGVQLSSEELNALIDAAVPAMDQLEAELKKGNAR